MKRLAPLELAATARRRIDVREFPEFAAGALPNAELAPLATLEIAAQAWNRDEPVALICRSGRRALQAAEKLTTLGFTDLAILDGGYDAWRALSLPVDILAAKPWSLERQVRAVAGALILLSAGLGLTVSAWFFGLTFFVGGGLLIAGLTDTCLMGTLLGKMPWNQAHRHCQAPSPR